MSIQVLGAAASYLGGVLLAQELGPHEYGRLALALALLSLLPQLSPFGINSAMVKLVPMYLLHDRRDRVAQLVVWGTLTVFLGSLVVAAAGTLAAVLTAVLGGHTTYLWPTLMAALATPAVAIIVLNLDICRAMGRIAAGFIPRALVFPLLPVLMLLTSAREVTGILAGVSALCAVLAALQSMYVWRTARITKFSVTERPPTKRWISWMRMALPMFVGTAANCVLNGAHTIVLAVFMDPTAVGAFQVAARTAALVSMPLLAANALAAPLIARLSGQAAMHRAICLLTHLLFWPSALLVVFLGFWGPGILSLFDSAFASMGYYALIVLAVAQLVNVGTGLVGSLLSMTGHHDVCAMVYAGAAISHVVLLYAVVPAYGLLGAALATAVPIAICNVTLAAVVRRRLGIHAHILALPGRFQCRLEG